MGAPARPADQYRSAPRPPAGPESRLLFISAGNLGLQMQQQQQQLDKRRRLAPATVIDAASGALRSTRALLALAAICILSTQTLVPGTHGLTRAGLGDCPRGWLAHAGSCYKFVRSSYAHFANASAHCETYNSRLVSVNNFEENDFLLEWLADNDPYKRLWLTSALVSNGQNNWQWSGDSSKFINNNDLWLPTSGASYERAAAFNGAAYAFSSAANKWGLVRVDSTRPAYSFVCELAASGALSSASAASGRLHGLDASRTLQGELHGEWASSGTGQWHPGEAPFPVGASRANGTAGAPRGPRITLEPRDVVFDISGRSHSNQLKLRCLADGQPEPTYTWYREEHDATGALVGKPLEPLDDERMTLTDGTLTIFNPNQQSDKGKYYCAASNSFGRVISQTVSITFGYILEFSKKRSIERGKENWGKSISCDAPQHHPRVLYYWTKAEFPNFVQEDKRVFISHDGNLYFSSLEKIDRSNYACQIQSLISSTGRLGPSFALLVEPASNGQKLQFANGFPKSFPESPLAGDEIRLECMAYGYPTPVYNWTRVSPSGHMPRGYSLRNDGKVLVLPNARTEDEGEYMCRASSENESLQKSVRVSVQAAPRFTQPLEDQVLGEREQLVWECEAFGLPRVTYSWFKNGEELLASSLAPHDAARYSIRENRLTIDAVQRDRDQGMFQCRASNQHASAFSSAQLRIVNLRPSLDAANPMPLSVQAMVEQNVSIACNIQAVPRPVITWRKEGQTLIEDRSRIRVTPLGLLQISRARVSDAGGYECQAENHLGSLTSKTWLIIKPAPVIVEAPLGGRREIAKHGDPLKIINCDVQTDYSMEITHVWLKNGLPLVVAQSGAPRDDDDDDNVQSADYVNTRYAPQSAAAAAAAPSAARKYTITETGQLIVRNISYADQANYTCRAQSSIGAVERSGQLLVRGPPDACGSVSADGLTQFSARVSWTDGSDHLSRILYNTIEGRTNHNSTWTVLAANITGQPVAIGAAGATAGAQYGSTGGSGGYAAQQATGALAPAHRKTHLLSGLLMPWSIYEFRVSATNEFGQGPPSEPSPKYRTDMSAPRLPVSNLRGGGGKAGTLSLRWQPLAPAARGANEIWYTIYYRPEGAFEWIKRELSAAGGHTDAHTLSVGADNFYKPFEVMVQPVNANGAGPLGQVARVRSAQQMPWVQPANVHGLAFNSTALNVTWTTPADLLDASGAADSGKLIGFRIRYWPSGRDPQTHSLTKLKRGTDPWGLVVGLQPDTEYQVAAMAYNEAGSGPESEPFRLRTFKSAPQRAPTSVQAEFLDDTSVRVTWRGVAPITTNEEPVMGYKVRYWRYDEPISAARDLIKPLGGGHHELSLVVGSLAPGETYKLRVLAYSAGGDGKMSSPELVIKIKSPEPAPASGGGGGANELGAS